MGYLAQLCAPPPIDRQELMEECRRIASIIENAINPLCVILFGSATTQAFTAFSDIDLLIVLKNTDEIRDAKYALAAQKILPKWPCDYLFVTQDRFNQMKDVGGPIFMAHTAGMVLVDKRTAV